jgi:Mn2+/Fe2+ NRAMP family transporter
MKPATIIIITIIRTEYLIALIASAEFIAFATSYQVTTDADLCSAAIPAKHLLAHLAEGSFAIITGMEQTVITGVALKSPTIICREFVLEIHPWRSLACLKALFAFCTSACSTILSNVVSLHECCEHVGFFLSPQ